MLLFTGHELEDRIAAQLFDNRHFVRAGRQVYHVQIALADLAAFAAMRLQDFFQLLVGHAGARLDQDAAARIHALAIAEISGAGGRHAGGQRQCSGAQGAGERTQRGGLGGGAAERECLHEFSNIPGWREAAAAIQVAIASSTVRSVDRIVRWGARPRHRAKMIEIARVDFMLSTNFQPLFAGLGKRR
jgi:hypothetical protein